MGLFTRKSKEVVQERAGSASVPPVRSDTTVTVEAAMGIAAVYRAVSILTVSVSQLPIEVVRGVEEIPAPSFIRQPDVKEAPHAFHEQTVSSLALNGNAYWLISRNGKREVSNLTVLNPNAVVIEQREDGTLVYNYGGKQYSTEDIKHLKLLRVPGSLYGLGPLQAARQEIRGTLDLGTYRDNWFSASGVPTGLLSTEQHLNEDSANAIRDRWNETQKERGTAVLGQGVKYEPIMLNPADALFIEVAQFSVNQIARLFGIPGTYLLTGIDGNSLTYANTEQLGLDFIRFTVSQYVKEIEQALSELLPRGQRARFNYNAFLRSDIGARYAAYQTALTAGFLTVDEVRKAEGLPPNSNIKTNGGSEGE